MAPRNTAKRNRRGFSMLELTLAIAIMAILMTAASIALIPRVLRAKDTVTRNTMKTVEQSLDEYRAFNNQYPATLAQLAPEYIKEAPKDGWKRDFQYRAPGAGGMPYDLISAGDDGEFGTSDDIDIWTMDEDG